MKLFQKPQKVVSPESKIQQADIQIEAQKDQFRKLAEEVTYGIELRKQAIQDLDTEAEILRIKAENKQKLADVEKDKLGADQGYLERVQQFIG